MTILGVDYGRKKLGLALGLGRAASPFRVLRVSSFGDAVRKVADIARREGVVRVVVGISEGELRVEQEKFAGKVASALGIRVDVYDETLTTKDAQAMSLEAGLPRKKRRMLEDAFAASVMLQSYLEVYGVKSKGSNRV